MGNIPILSIDDLVQLKNRIEFSVIIAVRQWFVVGEQLEKNNIAIRGIWQNNRIKKYERMTFERLDLSKQITLYAGDICDEEHLKNPNLYGLSIHKADKRHILPDYFSPYLKNISMKSKEGRILFDPTGGGVYGWNGVLQGGHIWFPNVINVRELLMRTKFEKFEFLCYHTEKEELVKKDIDYSKGWINRIPKPGEEDRPVYSIVIDCYK